MADMHFAPTERARQNLLQEGVETRNIVVTGNTVIDALYQSVNIVNRDEYTNEEIESLKSILDFNKDFVLVTGHRRENFGQGFVDICHALKEIAQRRTDIQIIYPVHLNPNVQQPVNEILTGVPNIYLIPPLNYPSFVWAMDKARIIITDSGGVQEEAPSLGKPVLVMRDTTERPEAVEAGTVILVGTNRKKIVSETMSLLDDPSRYAAMSHIENPYGDGYACKRIVETLKNDDFTGVDAILSVVPYYNKPSQEGIYQHYKAIAEATELPIVLYNVPGRTGVNMTAETTLRIARDFKNVVAIKEASGNITQMDDIIKNKPENFNVISGDDGITFPLITLGAVGVISVIGNAFPREFSRMTRLALQGDFANALTIHHRFTELFNLLFVDGNPAGVKSMLNAMGMIENKLRLPLVPTRITTFEAIRKVLNELNIKC